MKVEVVKEINKHLRQTWVFNMFDLNVVFVKYMAEERPPRKRIWRVTDMWNKYSSRNSNIEEPHLTDKLRSEALGVVMSKIRVKTWDEWKSK